MTAPLEIALNYPVEVGGVVHDKLVLRRKVAAVRRKRGNGALSKLAHFFNVPPAVIGELDETDLENVNNRLEDYLANLEG